jgi:PRTRC genetic system protein A
MIPVYLKTAEGETARDALHYLIAADGAFLVKRTPLFDSITRVEAVLTLEAQQPALTLHVPKLPARLLERLLGFFTAVYRAWDGEAVALLYYSPRGRRFRIEVPRQTLLRYRTSHGWRTEGRVQYGSVVRADGFLKLGDAHSHGDWPAFFSSTDDRDDGEDGLRVVIGRLDRETPEVRTSFVANGTRFALDPDEVFESLGRPISLIPPPAAWVRRVKCCFETIDTSAAQQG